MTTERVVLVGGVGGATDLARLATINPAGLISALAMIEIDPDRLIDMDRRDGRRLAVVEPHRIEIAALEPEPFVDLPAYARIERERTHPMSYREGRRRERRTKYKRK